MPLKDAPPGWGKDELTKFIDDAGNNIYGSFVRLKGEYRLISDIDAVFQKLAENLLNPSELFATFFLLRAHSSFRAAARLVLSGQVPEAYALLRLVLENTLYGYYFSKKPASREIWLNRHESEELKRKVREEFKIRNLLNVLKDSDPDLGKAIEILYERVIDYGAHPNERALTHNLKLTSDEEKHEFLVIYLSNDSDSLRLALRTAAQTGTGTLAAFRLIYKERFDLLGLTDILKQLRKVL